MMPTIDGYIEMKDGMKSFARSASPASPRSPAAQSPGAALNSTICSPRSRRRAGQARTA